MGAGSDTLLICEPLGGKVSTGTAQPDHREGADDAAHTNQPECLQRSGNHVFAHHVMPPCELWFSLGRMRFFQCGPLALGPFLRREV